MDKVVRILGTRGVPAQHGGFETAAENIGLELVRRGWRVVVYCQTPGTETEISRDVWRGIERVHLPERFRGPLGTIWFDALAMRHAAKFGDLCLTFGYNTAFLNERLRAKGVPTVINMDGVEWQRARWSRAQRSFLHLNERLACRLGDHLIADHPKIHEHLSQIAPAEKISTIAYGAPAVSEADPRHLAPYGVEPGRYLTLIARPVAENSIWECVTAFSRKRRGVKLVVLGDYSSDDEYVSKVRSAASDEVLFPGPIYDTERVQSLRLHSLAYVHGHTVGGTNPSLVEALGCGNPVLAHDNPFNRWVAQDSGLFFSGIDSFEVTLERLLSDPELAKRLGERARVRHEEEFQWSVITDRYEDVLHAHLPVPAGQPQPTTLRIPRPRTAPVGAHLPAQRAPTGADAPSARDPEEAPALAGEE